MEVVAVVLVEVVVVLVVVEVVEVVVVDGVLPPRTVMNMIMPVVSPGAACLAQ